VCMLFGLQRLSGVLGSLLLNLEAPFTILLAVTIFREHLGRNEVMGAAAIFLAAATLSYHPGVIRAEILGIVAMVAACLSWAIDNNLTQRLSLRDPVAVTRIKTLGAGACTLTLALMVGESFPRPAIIVSVLALGLVSYGVSLVLDTQALRLLGAAREATLFATAPFIGAVAAVPVLGERWGLRELVAAGIMAIGVITLLREHHSHEHSHSEIEHDHSHMHSDHHDHVHDAADQALEPHTHAHRHLALAHDHPHVSEAHHRHEHT
jgi:drug/metabolite transporter (DMT)-like permease